ncbi:prepilin-type N-terminal cleavage/methylation domain-containing protein [Aurantivibrio plasticivorans]
MRRDMQQRGFTLIELIAVIVIITILAVMGSSFVLQTANAYHDTVNRTRLIQTARQSIEQLTRYLRIAVPNSIRVSANNLCIEWIPVVGGGHYLGELPDTNNGASATSSISTGPMGFDVGSSEYVIVAPLTSAEVYGGNTVALYAGINSSSVPNVLSLTSAKQFLRNSVNKRIFIGGLPMQACVDGGELRLHEGYTSSGSLPSLASLTGSPPNTGIVMAEGVNPSVELPFSITNGTQDRNTIVDIEMPFREGGEQIVIRHQVMVRNVP